MKPLRNSPIFAGLMRGSSCYCSETVVLLASIPIVESW